MSDLADLTVYVLTQAWDGYVRGVYYDKSVAQTVARTMTKEEGWRVDVDEHRVVGVPPMPEHPTLKLHKDAFSMVMP